MGVGYNERTLAQNARTMVVTAKDNDGRIWLKWGALATYLLLGRVLTDALRPLVYYKSKR